MNLQFGLHNAIPATMKTAWGARWIYPADVIWDRQDLQGPDRETLWAWLLAGASQKARTEAVAADKRRTILQNSAITIVLFEDERGIIVGSPQGSYGYLYVAGAAQMTLEKGKTYMIRLRDKTWVSAEYLGEEPYGGYDMVSRALGGLTRHVRKRNRFHFRNLRTGRTITLRSKQKVREIEA